MKRVTMIVLWVIAVTAGATTVARAQQQIDDGGISDLVDQAIARGDLPGAVVCFADADKVRYLQSFGDRQRLPQRVPMTAETVFDMASITKPVATATSIAILASQGKLDVRAPVSRYLPEFSGHKKELITLEQCLLHTSGLIPDNSLADYDDGPELAWKRICELKLRSDPGTQFAYSDVGFIVLGKVVEKVSGMSLDVYAADQVFSPFGMPDTSFNPGAELKRRAAPTEMQGDSWLCGTVHDPRSARMGGVAGHAGLFSTANDLVTYGQVLLAASKGKSPVLDKQTFAGMTLPHRIPRGTRTLGWDHRSPYSTNRGTALSDSAFGHGGFTGTVLWIDPDKELIFVFLSSRLHPDGQGSVNTLAGEIVTRVAEGW